ncbi:hypothetical protein [uncultured Microbacterium sp.]|uniref:hypothetical protein n=1 Tax=uncultured Microbacterium sp. TaxID=191216 RepID=UPI0028D76EA1|nr:hypothetical protein [uncultured Microbacterium sp.]
MSTPIPPLVPIPDDGDPNDSVPRQDVDGEPALDADANPDEIDSADADRIAAEHGTAEQRDV